MHRFLLLSMHCLELRMLGRHYAGDIGAGERVIIMQLTMLDHTSVPCIYMNFPKIQLSARGMCHCRGTPSLSALASLSFLSSSGKVVSSNLNTFLCVYGVKMTCYMLLRRRRKANLIHQRQS